MKHLHFTYYGPVSEFAFISRTINSVQGANLVVRFGRGASYRARALPAKLSPAILLAFPQAYGCLAATFFYCYCTHVLILDCWQFFWQVALEETDHLNPWHNCEHVRPVFRAFFASYFPCAS
jgi:hypothetical protein